MCERIKVEKCTARCPECGQLCNCFYEDVGINRYYDRYGLYCPFCQKTFYQEVDGGEPEQPSEKLTFCPFCGVQCYEHRKVPPAAKNQICHKEELHGSITPQEAASLPCPKCGWPVKCTYQGNHGGEDFKWIWLHQCSNPDCGYSKECFNFASSGQAGCPVDSGDCPACGQGGDEPAQPRVKTVFYGQKRCDNCQKWV